MRLDDNEVQRPTDAPPVPPADQPTDDPTWYHRLNLLAAATLIVLIFCLVWRPTAWIGLGVAVISLSALFFYHYFTRAQLGLVEFIVMISVLSQTIGLTLSVLWPQIRDTDKDWIILAVWIVEAAWILCGALWASWVARASGLARLRDRLFAMLVGWLAVPAIPGLFVSAGLGLVGIPTWLLHAVQGQPDCIYPWWVLLAPFGIALSYWAIRTARGFHLGARRAESIEQERQEKVELPRAFTMNLRENTTPEDLPLEERMPTPVPEAEREASPRQGDGAPPETSIP